MDDASKSAHRDLFLQLPNRTDALEEKNKALSRESKECLQEPESFRQQEVRFRAAAESMDLGIAWVNSDCSTLFMNSALARMLRIDPDASIGRGCVWKSWKRKDPCLQCPVTSARKSRSRVEVETTIAWEDGHSFPARLIAYPAFGDNGEIAGFVETAEDVTERRRKEEEAFQQIEERYHRLFESLQEGIWAVDEKGNTLFANSRMAEMLGCTVEAMMDENLYSFIDEKAHETFSGYLEQRRADIRERHDVEFKRKDGSRIYTSFEATPITDVSGKYVGVLADVMDITDRKRMEEQLRESEEKYRTLVESTRDLIFTVDSNGCFTYVNPNFEKVTGHCASDLKGLSFIHILSPEYRPQAVDNFKRDNQDEQRPPYEVEILHKNGTKIPVEFLVSTLYDGYHQPIGKIGIGRDATGRWKAENEKRLLERQLLQAQKMEAVGTLAGGIAHDFNNLLMGIQGCASLMLLDMSQSHPFYEKLKIIEDQVRSGADLTGQLLGFARGGKYRVKPADLSEILKKTAAMFGRTKKEISIHQKYGESLWAVEVDHGQVEQVLLNLYVNAWQAMPGGGDLYLETSNVLLDDRYAGPFYVEPGKYVKVSVTDTGVGMDEKTRERIFEPFFTTKEMGRGTGLGLASAYGIVKGHGGHITVYSEKGSGTTFNIYFPASQKKVAAAIKQVETILRGTETVLLVDDEEAIVQVSKEILESLGYRVLTAGGGQRAIATYEERNKEIDLVVLDMIMPEMGGAETFDHLKTLNPEIKVILSSGYSLNEQAAEIMEKGCRAFIQKPFSVSDISRKIREVLGPSTV